MSAHPLNRVATVCSALLLGPGEFSLHSSRKKQKTEQVNIISHNKGATSKVSQGLLEFEIAFKQKKKKWREGQGRGTRLRFK